MTVVMKGKGCTGSTIGWWLMVVGALNWGLVGIGNFLGTNLNVVNLLLGRWSAIESLVYVLVGAAGIMFIVGCRCSTCRVDTPAS